MSPTALEIRDEKYLLAIWSVGGNMRAFSKHLQCYSQEKYSVASTSFSPTILPDSSHMMDICWSYGHGEKEHHGYINLEWLKKNNYSADTLHKLRIQSHPPIAVSNRVDSSNTD